MSYLQDVPDWYWEDDERECICNTLNTPHEDCFWHGEHVPAELPADYDERIGA